MFGLSMLKLLRISLSYTSTFLISIKWNITSQFITEQKPFVLKSVAYKKASNSQNLCR